MELLWSYIKKVSTGMVDEKVTVISSLVNVQMPRWKLRIGISLKEMEVEKWDQCLFVGY